jgi:hypothetical protein
VNVCRNYSSSGFGMAQALFNVFLGVVGTQYKTINHCLGGRVAFSFVSCPHQLAAESVIAVTVNLYDAVCFAQFCFLL